MSQRPRWQTLPGFQRAIAQPAYVLLPAGAGSLMLCAGFLPWLKNPLGNVMTAWSIPIDIGWRVHSPLFSYGLLCIICGLPAFASAYRYWMKALSDRERTGILVASVCCLMPILLFVFQYLCVDLQSANLLAQQKVQMLLIENLYGYKVSPQLLQLQPFEIDSSTLGGRFVVLATQVSPGLIVPFLSTCLLIYCQSLVPPTSQTSASKRVDLLSRRHIWLIGAIVGTLILSRPIVAMVCDYQAREALASGSYAAALKWLDAAGVLNPAFERVPYYHIQRGQAEYFLNFDRHNTDSQIYLASVDLAQENYPAAYQEMSMLWHPQQAMPSWAVDEMSGVLTRLAETARRQNDPATEGPDLDESVLPWLQMILQIDGSNVYAHYLMGRIQYNLHNYEGCRVQMTIVLQLSHNEHLQSSAYTYMALSQLEQGNMVLARQLLLIAVKFDPGYWNNTAREELSGLH